MFGKEKKIIFDYVYVKFICFVCYLKLFCVKEM